MAKKPLSIAIVTTDVAGPTRNSGVATACRSLAEGLASGGHFVTVLYLCRRNDGDESFHLWQRMYLEKGIMLVSCPEPAFALEGPEAARLSYAAYLALKDGNYDVAHFPDYVGLGFYPGLAKKQGIALANTHLCVNMHGPGAWHREFNGDALNNWHQLYLDHAERRSTELADSVVAPSRYILDWARARGWKLPDDCQVIQNMTFSASAGRRATSLRPRRAARPKDGDLVFFGRLETRKGLEVFCDALDRLPASSLRKRNVTFLGLYGTVHGQPARDFLNARLAPLGARARIINDLGTEDALAYIREHAALVVLPSLSENLPYAGIECIENGLPMIGSDIPAFRELLDPRDHRTHLCAPKADALAELIAKRLKKRVGAARFRVSPTGTREKWLAWHERLAPPKPARKLASTRLPKVTFCVVHHERPGLLEHCLRSIEKQTYPNIEVVLVDSGSRGDAARSYLRSLEPRFRKRGWKLIRSRENIGPARSRNLAAKNAKGEYLLFMDDDNVAKPEETEVFVQAALRTGADVLTCGYDVITTYDAPKPSSKIGTRWIPVGGAVGLGALINVFGDTNALVRRKTYLELGGMREVDGLAFEDYEFFSRVALKGYRFETIPEALYHYRRHAGGHVAGTNHYERLSLLVDSYSSSVPNREYRDLMELLIQLGRKTVVHVGGDYPLFNPARSDLFAGKASGRRRLFAATKASDFESLRRVDGLKLQSARTGVICVDESGGGGIELPRFTPSAGNRYVLEVEVVAMNASAITVRQPVAGRGSRGAAVSEVSRPVLMGLNRIQIPLDSKMIPGRIRIQPLREPGRCAIRRIELVSEKI